MGAVGPLGLAAAAPGPALVVDLDPDGPRYPGEKTLADLVAQGPRLADLEPRWRRGMACLGNGGIDPADSAEVVSALVTGWPYVVIRTKADVDAPVPRLDLRPLLPGGLFAYDRSPAVYQDAGWGITQPGPGPVLPRPRPATIRSLCEGVLPLPDRWLKGWSHVWQLPWA